MGKKRHTEEKIASRHKERAENAKKNSLEYFLQLDDVQWRKYADHVEKRESQYKESTDPELLNTCNSPRNKTNR